MWGADSHNNFFVLIELCECKMLLFRGMGKEHAHTLTMSGVQHIVGNDDMDTSHNWIWCCNPW